MLLRRCDRRPGGRVAVGAVCLVVYILTTGDEGAPGHSIVYLGGKQVVHERYEGTWRPWAAGGTIWEAISAFTGGDNSPERRGVLIPLGGVPPNLGEALRRFRNCSRSHAGDQWIRTGCGFYRHLSAENLGSLRFSPTWFSRLCNDSRKLVALRP